MTRLRTVTEKIGTDKTGLKSNLFIHVDFAADGTFDAVRFSEKGKDGSSLDALLGKLGDAASDIIMRRYDMVQFHFHHPHLQAILQINVTTNDDGFLAAIRFHQTVSDGSTLDSILSALSDATTDIIRGGP